MEVNVKRLKEGDEKVFENIVSAFWVRMFKFASIYVLDEELAKEITQDAFLSLWGKREELTDDTCFTTYLMVVTRNRCLDYLRKKQLEVVSIDELSEESLYLKNNREILEGHASELLMAKELEEAITRAIGKLPDRTRYIFEKSRKEGLMNKEIAEELGVSVKTVEFHITKALQQLRKELTNENFLMLLIFMSAYHP